MRWVIGLVLCAACHRGGARSAPGDAAPAAPSEPAAPSAADDPWSKPDQPAPERPLTDGEIALVRPIFGDSIDYAKVRVIEGHYAPFQPSDVCMTPRGKIYCPPDAYHDDYSAAEVAVYDQSGFVHEMTHVWQYANGTDLLAAGIEAFNRTGGNYTSVYTYSLDQPADLTTYGFEQQAAIVEDWFVLKKYRLANTLLIASYGDTLDRRYDEVMKKLLADPRYARVGPPKPAP